MPAYNAEDFRPPAPVALVTIRATTGRSIDDVPMLLDSGADVSLIPQGAAVSVLDAIESSKQYEVEAFDGARSLASAVQLELQLLGKSFKGQFLLIDSPYGIIGRNILNAVSLTFDGPSNEWREQS
jgi:hypothetical protein